MPASNALLTFSQLTELFPNMQTSDQTYYENLIDQASSRIEIHCERDLAERIYTDKILDGTGTSELVLPTWPVTSITTLNVDANRDFTSGTVIASTDYNVNLDTGIITLYSDTFPRQVATVKTTYTAGFATTNAKWVTLKSACVELVRWMDKRYRGDGVGIRSMSGVDGMNTAMEIDLPMNVRSLLMKFIEAHA